MSEITSGAAPPLLDQPVIVESRLTPSVSSSGSPDQWIVSQRMRVDKTAINPELEFSFNALAERWRAETRQLSSDSDIAAKFTYHQIIGMGERVLPLIFRELGERGGRWYWALRAITRENPVLPEDRGNVRRMNQRWLEWGRQQGYVR